MDTLGRSRLSILYDAMNLLSDDDSPEAHTVTADLFEAACEVRIGCVSRHTEEMLITAEMMLDREEMHHV
jgi:hypothetical protein